MRRLPKDSEQRDRDKEGREKGKDKDKKGRRERDRERDYARKMAAAQQVPMRMAMMQGMMGMNPAMHMAMMQQMGMVPPPPYLQAAMQRTPPPPPPPPPPSSAAVAVRHAAMFGGEGVLGPRVHGTGSMSSSTSDSSSDDSSGDEPGVLAPAAAMAAMAAMWPAATAAAASGEAGAVGGIEAFLSACPVDPEAADRFRALPPHLQQFVMRRGPISETRNPSAVLIARVRDAELGRVDVGGGEFDRAGSVGEERGAKPARRSAKVTIEAMIRDYRLSPGCAWMLRALPPDKQKLAARIDPAGQSDPSGYVAEQLKKIV